MISDNAIHSSLIREKTSQRAIYQTICDNTMIDEDMNKSCHKPKDLEKYLMGRIHWIQVTRKGEII